MMQTLKTFFSRFFSTHDPVETYLAQSKDMVDLENRLRHVQSGTFQQNPHFLVTAKFG